MIKPIPNDYSLCIGTLCDDTEQVYYFSTKVFLEDYSYDSEIFSSFYELASEAYLMHELYHLKQRMN